MPPKLPTKRGGEMNPVREQKFSNGVNIKTKEYPGFPTDLLSADAVFWRRFLAKV